MATFIEDERLNEKEDTEVTNIEEMGAPEPEPTPEPQEDIPEKYQGKSTAEIVRMHQEAEKLLGKQSGEVGELRSVVDSYIQTQLDSTTPPKQEPDDEDIDFFSDPDKAVERAIANHPSIKKAEETTRKRTVNSLASLGPSPNLHLSLTRTSPQICSRTNQSRIWALSS